ncbi:hypothetical protein E1B28_009947 [Marasmius oreades]|uniref:Uncharacterized protein n=1 Tax=Marasmius oreades TaxID=181124 RepID=A0A9P7RW36_9AGAR|nr:uncharacterized protein E1B28_009947 [Marasmius oreades]KAG7090866.1 hypothetical protein E1B28_009947 [Marasmius oreades]
MDQDYPGLPPNPANHLWTKQDDLHIQIVLPLWTKDELVKCFEVTPRNTKFLNTLHESFDEHGNAKAGVDQNIASRFKSALEQARLQADTHPGPLDRTSKLSVLIDVAMAKFGPLVRDVFTAVVDPSCVEAKLEDALMSLNLDHLATAVTSTANPFLPGTSHWIIPVAADGEQIHKVAVNPELRITIRSTDVANRAMRRLRQHQLETERIIHSCVKLFSLQCAWWLAGWLFKGVAPRFLVTSFSSYGAYRSHEYL